MYFTLKGKINYDSMNCELAIKEKKKLIRLFLVSIHVKWLNTILMLVFSICRHLRRVLDTSSSMRYSGLPNNCQLELIESAVPRTASSVTVNIATDDGVRLVHDFPATCK